MSAPTRSTALWTHAAALTALVALLAPTSGCGDPGSNLERRARKMGDSAPASGTPAASAGEAKDGSPTTPPATPPPATTSPATTDTTPTAAQTPTPDGLLNPGSGDRVLLRHALPEGATYRVTTVGMAQFPMMPKPTGFAREESLVFDQCEGEGATRSCRLTRTITNFDAEPPYGKFIAGDEDPFRSLVTRQRIDARGEPIGEVTVEGPEDKLGTPAAAAVVGVHPFYCARFPDEPVGQGARWQVTCSTRHDGRVSQRKVVWELTALTDDPADGKRAELRGVASYTIADPKGDRTGTVGGALLFFVDAGAPHLLRETMTTDVAASAGLSTRTNYNVQFALVDPADPKKIRRTDGKPFPEAPAPTPGEGAGDKPDDTKTKAKTRVKKPDEEPRPRPKVPPPT